MGFSRLKRILPLFFFLTAGTLFSDVYQNRILYLIHANEFENAFSQYLAYQKQKGRHDFELLQQISLILLDQGIKSSSPEIQLMAIFGAGISMNEKSFYLLEEGLNSSHPEIQVIALNFLAKSQNDQANVLINRLVANPHPLIRLEAAYQLALKRHPLATAQIEALMYKMGDEIAPVFPKLFAVCGDAKATKMLRKLLAHSDSEVRCEAILSAAEFGRDDLIPLIRKLATHHDIAQQEACATALGELKDEGSLAILKRLAYSKSPSVKLAALIALNRIGDASQNHEILQLARSGDPFAIGALGEIQGSEELLINFIKSSNLQMRINASLALLELKDERCLPGLLEILIRDSRDLAFVSTYSMGKGLSALKAVPCATQNLEDTPLLHELSLGYREEVLEKLLNLKEETFISVAAQIFDMRQNDLIPVLVELLINLGTPESTALLKKEQQKTGAPLIRNYCNLALFRMSEEGPYEKNLRNWIMQQRATDMMRFRAFVPFDMREKEGSFQLTPEETARLLIESFEAIAIAQEDKGIDLLLESLIEGNEKNRYVLAGLLLRATQ